MESTTSNNIDWQDQSAAAMMKICREMSEKFGKLEKEFAGMGNEMAELRKENAELREKVTKNEQKIATLNREMAKLNNSENRIFEWQRLNGGENANMKSNQNIVKVDVIVKQESEEIDEINVNSSPPKLVRQQNFLNGQMEEEVGDMPSPAGHDEEFDYANNFGMNIDEEEDLNEEIMSPLQMEQLSPQCSTNDNQNDNNWQLNIQFSPIRIGPHLKCNWPGCQFSTFYKNRTSISRHWLTHTGERPEVCPICGETFTHVETLYAHLQDHGVQRPFCCGECGQQFKRLDHLKRHQRLFHKEISQKPEHYGLIINDNSELKCCVCNGNYQGSQSCSTCNLSCHPFCAEEESAEEEEGLGGKMICFNCKKLALGRKRSFDVVKKLEVIEWARKNSLKSAAKKFFVGRKSVRDWMNAEEKLRRQLNLPGGSKRKRLGGGGRPVTHPEIDNLLANWIKEMGENKTPVSKSMIRNKATELFANTGMKVSSGWLHKFLNRNNFIFHRQFTAGEGQGVENGMLDDIGEDEELIFENN